MIHHLLLGALLAASPKVFENSSIEVVSLDSTGAVAEGCAIAPSLSDNGQLVVFASDARDLTPDEGNFQQDIFLFDRGSGMLELVSRAAGGGPTSGGDNEYPDISNDGRFVAFSSNATNIVTPDTSSDDVFIYDRTMQTAVMASRPTGGGTSLGDSRFPRISGNGNWVVFISAADNLVTDNNSVEDVFLYNRTTAALTRINLGPLGEEANGDSNFADISFDGRFVVFDSFADNLVAGDDNSLPDVFLYDRVADEVTLLSRTQQALGNGGSLAPRISDDARFVAFLSNATNLDPADTNFAFDAVRLDRQTGVFKSVSLSPSGVGIPAGLPPAISGDGLTVAFTSAAEDLVPGDTNAQADLFVSRDGRVEILNIGPNGEAANNVTLSVALDGSGNTAAFDSLATNLFPGDDNACLDVFVRQGSGAAFVRSDLDPPPDVDPGDSFGSAVAVGSGTVAVGIPSDANLGSTTGTGSGRVALYNIVGGQSVPAGEVAIPDGASAEGFGSSIDIADGLMAVGAPMTDVTAKGGGANPMQLAIYERTGGSWNVKQTVTGGGGGSSDGFGASVAMDGNLMVVGAPMDQAAGESQPSGAVYLFGFDGSEYVQLDKVKPAAAGGSSQFGESVAIDKGRIVVGAPGSSLGGALSGAVELWNVVAGNMQPAGAMMPSGLGAGDGFGASVSMDGDRVLAGAPGTDVAGQDGAGSAWTFAFDGGNALQLVAPEPLAGAGFGQAVAAAHGELSAGAPGAGGGSVFQYGAAGLDLLQQLAAPAGQSGFGSSLAVSSLGIAIGAPTSSGSAGAASVLSNPGVLFADSFESD